MSCSHGRFNYKLKPLSNPQALRNVIFRLQQISAVLSFCVFSKKKDPEKYGIYVKMGRKSRISVFHSLKGLLISPPYGPQRKIVKNLSLHYASRKECAIYVKDDDEREQKELEIYIEDVLLQGDGFPFLMREAIAHRDRRLFFTLLNNWKYYTQLDNIIQSTVQKQDDLCKIFNCFQAF